MIMKFVDRINDWMIKRQRRPAGPESVQFEAEHILLRRPNGDRRVSWSEIDRIVATRSDQFVGDTIMLLFELHDMTGFGVSESSKHWKDVNIAIPNKLVGAKAYELWALELVGSPSDKSIDVYRRDGGVG
jgi:hypothetical protein